MKKTTFYILNILLVLGIWLGDMCFTFLGGLWIKGLTSAFFVILAAVNLIYAFVADVQHKKFAIVMLVGFVFAFLGDIVLNLKGMFMYGAILFAIGHVFYYAAYCLLVKFNWRDIVVGATLAAVSVLVITLVPLFNFGGVVMQMLCIVYALIISFMLGKAVSNLIRQRNLLNLIIVIGSFLFFFSDLMLLFDVFANLSIVFDLMCLATYYPAQAILAFSLLLLPPKEADLNEKDTSAGEKEK